MNDRDELTLLQRIRERAYRLWEEAGRPTGREHEHWDKATELIAIEDGFTQQTETTEPAPAAEPAKPGAAIRTQTENQADVPSATDRGDQEIPSHLDTFRR